MRIRLQRFKKFGELSWNEQLLFSEAYFLQLTTGLLLKIIPFRWIPRLFANPSTSSSQVSRLRSQISSLEQIKTAIQHTSKISPWRNKCLIQSLSARRMLNRRKIQSLLSLGVTRDENGRMIAHAWLKAGDFEVVEKSGDYRELYLF